MSPLIALEIVNNSVKVALLTLESMTPEQRQYWIQKGIDNDKAVVAWITGALKALGIEGK